MVAGTNNPRQGGDNTLAPADHPQTRRKLGRTPAEYPVSPFGHIMVAARGFSRGRGHRERGNLALWFCTACASTFMALELPLVGR